MNSSRRVGMAEEDTNDEDSMSKIGMFENLE